MVTLVVLDVVTFVVEDSQVHFGLQLPLEVVPVVLLLVGRYAFLVVLLTEVRGSDVKDFSRDLLLVQFNCGVVVVGHGVNPVCSS